MDFLWKTWGNSLQVFISIMLRPFPFLFVLTEGEFKGYCNIACIFSSQEEKHPIKILLFPCQAKAQRKWHCLKIYERWFWRKIRARPKDAEVTVRTKLNYRYRRQISLQPDNCESSSAHLLKTKQHSFQNFKSNFSSVSNSSPIGIKWENWLLPFSSFLAKYALSSCSHSISVPNSTKFRSLFLVM